MVAILKDLWVCSLLENTVSLWEVDIMFAILPAASAEEESLNVKKATISP